MKKILKFFGFLLLIPVVIVAGAITYLKFADLNPYKPQIEEILHKYANIDVKINGNLDVGISLKPSIELNDADVFDPTDGDKIAKIGKALVQISILPLLDKEIVVDVVEMNAVKIYTGENDQVDINAAELTMDDYKSPINLTFLTTISGIDIDGLMTLSSLQRIQADKYDKTDVVTTINALGYTLDFDGNISGLQSHITANGKYDVKYKNNTLKGDIYVSLAENVPYVKANINSEVINIADFTTSQQAANNFLISNAAAAKKITLDIPYEYLKMANSDVDFDIKKIIIPSNVTLKNVQGNAHLKDGGLKAAVQKLNFNDNSITGEVKIEQGKLPYAKITVTGSDFDLTKYASNTNQSSNWLINNAYASQLMANVDIPYEYLQIANANMTLNLKKLTLTPDIKLSDIQVVSALLNGNLNTNIKNITAGTGTIQGTVILSAKNKTLSADLTGKDILLQQLYTPYSDPNNSQMYVKSGGKTNFLIKVNTSGSNTDQYLSNLNGQMIAFIDESVLKIKSLERLQGNIIAQILNTLKISDITKKDTKLSCAVVRSDIKNGKAEFPKGIVFDAKDFYLVANGSLNLSNDKINFDLQPFSGKLDSTNISSILGSLLKITGTVNQPKISINQTSAAKNVVGFLASAGAYNVGDMVLSTDSAPCHTALQGTVYASYFKGDDSIKGNVSKSYDDVKGTIKDVGKNIKGVGKDIKNQAKDLGKQLKGLFSK